MNPSQKLNILVLGGQSSIGKHFMGVFDKNACNVYATTSVEIASLPLPTYVHWFSLDVTKEESVQLFLNNTSGIAFDVIINLIGKTSEISLNSTVQVVSKYFNSFITNCSMLLIGLVRRLPLGSGRKPLMINVSSRAVKYGSLDPFYSEAKSAVHGLIKSLNKVYESEIHFYNLVPGLLENSTMFENMGLNLRNQHRERAGGSLMSVAEFANFLNEFVLDRFDSKEIKKILDTDVMVGPQYL